MKVNAYIMYMFGKLSFNLYMQPKIISKCISLKTSKRQRHIYISDTENMVEIYIYGLYVSDRTLIKNA